MGLKKIAKASLGLIILLLFSGCGFQSCISAPDLMFEQVVDIIPTNPVGLNVDKTETYWVKSGVQLYGGESIKPNVKATNLSLCNDAFTDVFVYPGQSNVDLGFLISPQERIRLSLNMSQNTLTEADCRNQNPGIFVLDPSDCLKSKVGTTYSYKLDNSDTPQSNRFYPDKKNKRWINGKIYVLNNAICTGTTSESCAPEMPKLDQDEVNRICLDPINNTVPSFVETSFINSQCGNICETTDNGVCAHTEVSKSSSDSSECSSTGGGSSSWIESLYVDRLNSKEGELGGVCSGGYDHDLRISDTMNMQLTLKLGDEQGSGGYNLRISKNCDYYNQRALYMYISESEPTMKPGESGTVEVDFSKNDDGTFQFPEGAKGSVYYGVKDNGDGYGNNIGYFTVRVAIPKKPPAFISVVVQYVRDMINKILFGSDSSGDIGSGAVSIVYNSIITNVYFINLISALLLLYVTIYSLLYLFGLFRASRIDLLVVCIKIGVVIRVIQPDSWSFFNEYLFQLFTAAPIELINIMTGVHGSGGDFGFLDGLLFRFTMPQTWLQILSLLFAGPVGWLVVAVILWGLFMLLGCLFEAIIVYFMSIIIVAILLCIAPFFIICMLFHKTKGIFDSWIKSLIQTVMQPVFVFSALAMLTAVMTSVIYSLFNFDICTACIADASIDFGALGSINFCLLDFLLPLGFSPISTIYDHIHDSVNGGGSHFIGIPIPLMNVFMFIILAHAMNKFVEVSGEIAAGAFGSFAHFAHEAGRASQGLLSLIGMDQNSRDSRAYQAYHAELADRGDGSVPRSRGAPSMPTIDSSSDANSRDMNYQSSSSSSGSSGGGSI